MGWSDKNTQHGRHWVWALARRGLTHLKFKALAKSKLFPAFFLFAAICCCAANPADCVSRPRWLDGCGALSKAGEKSPAFFRARVICGANPDDVVSGITRDLPPGAARTKPYQLTGILLCQINFVTLITPVSLILSLPSKKVSSPRPLLLCRSCIISQKRIQ